jgi:hypothetical protein
MCPVRRVQREFTLDAHTVDHLYIAEKQLHVVQTCK